MKGGGMEPNPRGADQARLLLGRLLCIPGLTIIPFGAYFVSIATEFVAVCLGVVGFYLGARRLGLAVVVLAVAATIVGLLWGAGYIPSLLADDGGADGTRRGLGGER